MTNPGGDWQETFDAARRIPGPTKQHPGRKTFEDIAQSTAFARRRYASDIAVDFGAVDTGDDFDPHEYLSQVAESITENTEAIASLNDVVAAVNSTAAYVSDIDGMATIPRSSLSVMGFAVSNRPKYQDILQSINTSTFPTGYWGVPPVIKPVVASGISQGHIYYVPIVVNRTGVVGDLTWMAGADTSILSIDYYEMALCIYNPDTGDVEKVWGSGDIKDAEGGTTVFDEVFIDMGIDQVCQPGQILFVAHQQTAPSVLQDARRIAAAPTPPIRRTRPLLDAWCFVAESHSQGIPSAIDFASLTRENRFVPWMSVSVAAA